MAPTLERIHNDHCDSPQGNRPYIYQSRDTECSVLAVDAEDAAIEEESTELNAA